MSKRLSRILWCLCVLLIAAQTVIAAFYTIPQSAGLIFLQDATRVSETGKILFSSPLMSLWGLLCRAFHMKTLTFALKVLPFAVIPLSYLAYVFLIRALPGPKEQAPFILLLVPVRGFCAFHAAALLVYRRRAACARDRSGCAGDFDPLSCKPSGT